MNSPRVRIFVTTSHISTVYMTILARTTKQDSFTDILLIDTGTRRKELLTLIRQTASLHQWATIADFSEPVEKEHDFKPTLRKRLTRKAKALPVIRSVYKKALDKYMDSRDQEYAERLETLFSEWIKNVNDPVELFMMTGTYLNRPLCVIFPEAAIHYMEHGIGDYYYILDKEIPKGDLYAVFAKPYRRYLDAIGRKDILVVPIPGIDEFQKYAKQLLQIHRNIIHPEKLVLPQKPVIYILLEAVDMYEVREEFWTNYIDHILKKINSPKDHHFILKLHPMHSKHSLVKTENYFRKLGLEFSVLGDEIMSSASAEVVFSHYADHTTDVFCLFSSSCFYLSQLYSDKGIRFWYSTNFFMDYIENAPPQYHKLYVEIKPILDNVMAEKCSSY